MRSPTEPMLTVLVPVLSESLSAARCLRAACEAAGASGEVILVDGGISQMISHLVEHDDELRHRVRSVSCITDRRLWTLLRLGVAEARGKYVIIASTEERLEPGAGEALTAEAEAWVVDALQFRVVTRLRHIPVKDTQKQQPEAGLIYSGEVLRDLLSYDGAERQVTPHFTDKLYRLDLLREALRHRFDGSWGTGEILNLHYYRAARSMAFSDVVGVSRESTPDEPVYDYHSLCDIRLVYEMKLVAMPHRTPGLLEELRGYTLEYISNLVNRLGWTHEAACHYLGGELSRPIYRQAGLSEDIDEVVGLARKTHRRKPWRILFSLFIG